MAILHAAHITKPTHSALSEQGVHGGKASTDKDFVLVTLSLALMPSMLESRTGTQGRHVLTAFGGALTKSELTKLTKH